MNWQCFKQERRFFSNTPLKILRGIIKFRSSIKCENSNLIYCSFKANSQKSWIDTIICIKIISPPKYVSFQKVHLFSEEITFHLKHKSVGCWSIRERQMRQLSYVKAYQHLKVYFVLYFEEETNPWLQMTLADFEIILKTV